MAFPPPHSFMFNNHEDHDQLPSTSLNTFPSFPPQHFQQGQSLILSFIFLYHKKVTSFIVVLNCSCGRVANFIVTKY